MSILRSDKRQKEELLEKTRKKIKNSEEATEKVKAIPEAIEQQQIEYEKSVRDFAELSESYESANGFLLDSIILRDRLKEANSSLWVKISDLELEN